MSRLLKNLNEKFRNIYKATNQLALNLKKLKKSLVGILDSKLKLES